jgi:hypothetical protein
MMPPNNPDKDSPRNAANPLITQIHPRESARVFVETPEMLLQRLREAASWYNMEVMNDPSRFQAWALPSNHNDSRIRTRSHQNRLQHLKDIIEEALRITEDWSDMED